MYSRKFRAWNDLSFFKKRSKELLVFGEIPLLETKGNSVLSRPQASIVILEATHLLIDNEIYTKGKYKVVEVFKDEKIYFEGFERVGSKSF